MHLNTNLKLENTYLPHYNYFIYNFLLMEKLKFLLVVIIIGLFGLNGVSAFDEHRKVAEEYIESVSTFDHFWKGKNPHISGEKSFFISGG
ncbi:hypothetical protein DLH72_02420 [Candidatus Gracilibacteria bacterium]|nr:MAG: hypothetical protein DLH72_02420 [Candidatus Gracilibacteria bacterium]